MVYGQPFQGGNGMRGTVTKNECNKAVPVKRSLVRPCPLVSNKTGRPVCVCVRVTSAYHSRGHTCMYVCVVFLVALKQTER